MSLRLLMMGTGTFALPTFRYLCESHHEVVGLVTQPDRTGRGHHHHANEMKEAALERDVPVYQPASANEEASLARLRDVGADLFVVAAYGQILSAELLDIPPRGAINVHASLLPKYRGAAPILYAILNGETETGVSIFQIEPRLDAGPVLGMVSTPIGSKETTGHLEERLAQLAPALTLDVIDRLEAGTAVGSPQETGLVSKAPRLRKQQGGIDWTQSSRAVACHVRAMQPWPKSFTFFHRADAAPMRLLILDVDPSADVGEGGSPGMMIHTSDESSFVVRTGDGAIRVNRLQPAGKRPMSAEEFLRGHAIQPGDRLGPESPAND